MVKASKFKHFSLLLFVGILSFGFILSSCDSNNDSDKISGYVMSGEQPLEGFIVTIRSSGTGEGVKVLGDTVTDSEGFFSIKFNAPSNPEAFFYLTADSGVLSATTNGILSGTEFIRLATTIRDHPLNREIMINERTTVATAYTLAQFFKPEGIDGEFPGPQNGSAIVENLVNLSNGEISDFLLTIPNLTTSTRAAFNSLSNMLASCVRDDTSCDTLFELATTPDGTEPSNTLRAVANIARFPWQNVDELFNLSEEEQVYFPALATDADMTAWTLALRYQGRGLELNGPGNIAFDEGGNAWVGNNYIFSLDPEDPDGRLCGDEVVYRFTPTGEDFPGSPYGNAGVYGVGYGVTFDPDGNFWVGNFGFQGTNCPYDLEELSQTVSKYASDGTAISPASQGNETGQFHGGYQGAGNYLRQPQGVVSDKDGNIWMANCSGDSIVQFPNGDPSQAFNIEHVTPDGSLVIKPFDVAIDANGNTWSAGNESGSIISVDVDGNLLFSLTGDDAKDVGIIRPMGVATDSLGNAWVADSGVVRAPCDGTPVPTLFEVVVLAEDPDFTGKDAGVTMITSDYMAVGPFKGGGILIPWGIAVDGDDNVWIANFQGSTVSVFCGAAGKCPAGLETGDPIAPDGYFFNGLKRNTAVEIDPSGNVWATNNWEIIAIPQNPGGKELVVFLGLAKPVKAPVIGPPEPVQ
jgi:sugar lactone lactonase YvrE